MKRQIAGWLIPSFSGASVLIWFVLLTGRGATAAPVACAAGHSVPAPLTATATCTPAWTLVSSPDPSTVNNSLIGVSTVAVNDIWAVGFYDLPNFHASTLTEHWNGASWTVVPSPSVGQGSMLFGVAAVGANDVWAVGTSYTSIGQDTLTLHWDGTQWQLVPSPSPGMGTNTLDDVTTLASDDVWAVGVYGTSDGSRTLALHWDGNQWSVVFTPNYSLVSNELRGIAARTPNDIWAVGFYWVRDPWQTLIMHWDGQAWRLVPSQDVAGDSLLYGVSAVAADDAWVVGSGRDLTLTEHWDGTQWRIVPSPNGSSGGYLYGVTTLALSDAWAVGYTPGATLALHWDGAQWRLVPSPNPSWSSGHFKRAAAVSATDVWAVGYYIDADWHTQTLVEHYADPCLPPPPTWTPTPPPTVTGTPPTATPTPTVCPITFTDVDPTNPFYPFIRCLACRGLVSGYADGTFRWGAAVTRGQLAKILAQAAGLSAPVPTTQQTFADVPVTNPFWLWVERLAATGAISGYACGGPGEPCDPSQRPYFRWGAPATRGQIAKITARAAQLPDPIPTTRQTFADVPATNPFWLPIEQLAGRGIISGYACGGPGEPCDPPQRPYFRWGAPATRGQMAKIAATTFFSHCQTPARR